MAVPEISEQEMLFVEEYCKDRNAVRSVLKAGYSKTYQAAAEFGRQLLKKPEIKFWITRLLKRHAQALKFKPEKIVKNWMMAAFADPTYFVVDEEGKVDTVPGVPKEFLRVVRRVKPTKYGHEIELRDPHGPEVKLMEHFKELTQGDNGPSLTSILGQFAALLTGRLPDTQRSSGVDEATPEPASVDPVEGPTGDGLPE